MKLETKFRWETTLKRWSPQQVILKLGLMDAKGSKTSQNYTIIDIKRVTYQLRVVFQVHLSPSSLKQPSPLWIPGRRQPSHVVHSSHYIYHLDVQHTSSTHQWVIIAERSSSKTFTVRNTEAAITVVNKFKISSLQTIALLFHTTAPNILKKVVSLAKAHLGPCYTLGTI